jgi:hypothetical protein
MAITVHCNCGKTLKIDEKHRGKKAKCPECGESFVVEDADTAVTDKPRKRAAARRDDDDDDRDDDSRRGKFKDKDDDRDDDSGIRKKVKKEPARSNLLLFGIGGGCAFLLISFCCLTGIGGLVYYFFFYGAAADLVYVHDGVSGFVSIRVADGWKSPVVQDQIIKKLPPDAKRELDNQLKEIERKGEMRVEDLERMTIIIRSLDNLMNPDMAIVLKTSKRIDQKKAIESATKDGNLKKREVKHEGLTLFILEGGFGQSQAICFPSNNIMLVSMGGEDKLKDILKQSKKPPKNAALARGVQMATAGRHHVVAAFEMKANLMNNMPEEFARQAPSLKEMNGVIVGITANKDLAYETIFTFPSNDKAEKGKKDIEALKVLAEAGLKQMGNAPPALQRFMDSVTIEQRGTEVVAKARMEVDMDAFLNMQGGGFPRPRPRR